MLKRLKSAGLVPALVVSAVLAAAMIVPASANFLTSLGTPGCGYGYPAVGAPTITGVTPAAGPTTGGTSVVITGTNFCNVTSVKFGTLNATTYTVNSRTKITATSPAAAPGTVDVRVTTTVSTSAITPKDHFRYITPQAFACSNQQYRLQGSDGASWDAMDTTNLAVGLTAPADGFVEFGGNADLFTTSSGYNQDLGITVVGGAFPTTSGQPEAWKESGGFAGTFSPNAAYVQTVVPVSSGVDYVAYLSWKTNKADSGSVYAGAGPIGGRYSPTCIHERFVSAGDMNKKKSTQQYTLTNSNGTTWQDVDGTNLSVTFTAPGDGSILVGGNADLWTEKAGFNQDLGISVSGGAYPTTAGQPEAWKESGGFAGTFSPNAAFVSDVLPVSGSTTYTVKLQWKTNKGGTSKIHSGAGPIGGNYSPTALSIEFMPTAPLDKVSTLQYHLTASDGQTWQAVDPFKLVVSITPSSDCFVYATANADLFTTTAGYNQDIGIGVVDDTFPSFANQPEGWKESGGFAGTFSPNAAFEHTPVSLTAGHTYTFMLMWKTNKNDPSGTIYAGAGPIPSGNFNGFSPTRLTVLPIGC